MAVARWADDRTLARQGLDCRPLLLLDATRVCVDLFLEQVNGSHRCKRSAPQGPSALPRVLTYEQ